MRKREGDPYTLCEGMMLDWFVLFKSMWGLFIVSSN